LKKEFHMKLFLKILAVSLICGSLFACITTREQLNAEKGISSDGSGSTAESAAPTEGDVKSEDISVKSSQAPEVVKNAEPVQAAPQTAPAMAPAAATPKQSTKSQPDASNYSAEELRAEVARLTGEVEESEHNKQLSEQAHADAEKKDQERIAELEKKLKELQPDAPVVPEGKTAFVAGKDAYLANHCDEAIPFLSQSIAKSDASKEAEEATYLRGECYFKKAEYNKAIVDFSHFPEKYQKSSYHPKALLGIAESFEAMGRKDDARAFYSDLVDKFPKTAEGKLAQKRLKAKK
jgi:TolA-binding protein